MTPDDVNLDIKMSGLNNQANMNITGSTDHSTNIAQINNNIWLDSDGFWHWLSSTKHDEKHQRIGKIIVDETGTWLLRNPYFKKWKSGTQDVLWLKGSPGSGKSCLTYRVVDEAVNDNDSNAAYFYCDFTVKDSLNAILIMQSILSQLLYPRREQKLKSLVDFMRENHYNPSPKRCLTWDNMKEYILRAANTLRHARIIIDGIDECDDVTTRDVIRMLAGLSQSSRAIHVFFSSRSTSKINELLTKSNCVSISLDEEEIFVKRDINAYLSARFQEHGLRFGDHLEDTIREKMKADPNFRLTELRISRIKDSVDERWVRKILDEPVHTLDQEYMSILKGIAATSTAYSDPSLAEYIRTFLLWIVTTRRPLSKDELQDAMSLDQKTTLPSEITPIFNLEKILDACKDLITVKDPSASFRWPGFRRYHSQDSGDSSLTQQTQYSQDLQYLRESRESGDRQDSGVQQDSEGSHDSRESWGSRGSVAPAHFSVKEFFSSEELRGSELSRFYIPRSQAEKTLTLQTIRYLLLDRERATQGTPRENSRLPHPRALHSYAANYWTTHAYNAMVELEEELAQRRKLRPIPHRFFRYVLKRIRFRQSEITIEELPIYQCAQQLLFNDSSQRENFLSERYSSELAPRTDVTSWPPYHIDFCPLYYPVRYRLWRITSWFLEQDPALCDAEIANIGTPLLLAVENNDVRMIELLVDRFGADVNRSCRARRWMEVSPIFYAAHLGHFESFDTLRNKGAEVNVLAKYFYKDEHTQGHGTPILYDAAYRGNTYVVKRLLDVGSIKINQVNGDGCTALFAAAEGRHKDTMELLIQRGIDKYVRSNNGKTVLDVVLEMHESDMTELLVNAMRQDTPISQVALHSHELGWAEGEPWFEDLIALSSTLQDQMPETWARSEASFEGVEAFTEFSPSRPCLTIEVTGLVKRVKIHTVSHDQGWTTQLTELDGGYQGSHTFFEMGLSDSHSMRVETGDNHDDIRARKFLVQKNIRASRRMRVHVNDFDVRNPSMTTEMKEWLASLRNGDEIGIYPKALNRAWTNYVRRIYIELWCVRESTT
ncbi:hypothetical protein F5Y04DRAFT_253124 [Hypomontagnella monticulosa]|nr:hypothetical protein F5Y04DRAFT_253124 [Hypomontagnella monticulosa]